MYNLNQFNEKSRTNRRNFVGALCESCNFLIIEKQKTLPCIAHNEGRYDIRYVIDGITDETTEIIWKSGDNFISVKLTEKYGENYKKYSLNFVDSFNFLSTSIEKTCRMSEEV